MNQVTTDYQFGLGGGGWNAGWQSFSLQNDIYGNNRLLQNMVGELQYWNEYKLVSDTIHIRPSWDSADRWWDTGITAVNNSGTLSPMNGGQACDWWIYWVWDKDAMAALDQDPRSTTPNGAINWWHLFDMPALSGKYKLVRLGGRHQEIVIKNPGYWLWNSRLATRQADNPIPLTSDSSKPKPQKGWRMLKTWDAVTPVAGSQPDTTAWGFYKYGMINSALGGSAGNPTPAPPPLLCLRRVVLKLRHKWFGYNTPPIDPTNVVPPVDATAINGFTTPGDFPNKAAGGVTVQQFITQS